MTSHPSRRHPPAPPAPAELPAFAPLSGVDGTSAEAAARAYASNQYRLTGFIKQTQHLLKAVDALADTHTRQVPLTYPMQGLAGTPRGSQVLHDEAEEQAQPHGRRRAESDACSEIGTAATLLRHGHKKPRSRSPSLASPSSPRAGSPFSASASRAASPVAAGAEGEDDDQEQGLFKVLHLAVPVHEATGQPLLPAAALAPLLAAKLAAVDSRLAQLAHRVRDRTVRVLVTGDLNAGKSSFVNALLRRAVVPVDQQPTTNVFTEVVDAKFNKMQPGTEEVHAVVDAGDLEGTVDKYPLEALERLVAEPEPYGLLRVFIREEAAPAPQQQQQQQQAAESPAKTHDDHDLAESVLGTSSVLAGSRDADVRVIDSPGLNRDVWQTTAVFASQAEIDVVVFVVSAENHLTLSSREFLAKAGEEKQYIFVVVNKFDAIKNKDKCAKAVMQQIASLSPHTAKHAKHLVHFASAEAMLREATTAQQPAHDDSDVATFLSVERALKQFALEKRAVAKLGPAKRFLDHVLGDTEVLLEYNARRADALARALKVQADALRPRELHLAALRDRAVSDAEDAAKRAAAACDAAIAARLEGDKLVARLEAAARDVPWRGLAQAPAYVAGVRDAIVSALEADVDGAQRDVEAAVRRAWLAVDAAHKAWVAAARAVNAADASPSASAGGSVREDVATPIAPLKLSQTPLVKLYPVAGTAGQGLGLSARVLLFPHLGARTGAVAAAGAPFALPSGAAVRHLLTRDGFVDAWQHVWASVAHVHWVDAVSPARLVAYVTSPSSTATLSSLALTGCSVITSTVLSVRANPHAGSLVNFGMRVGLKRAFVLVTVGAAAAGAAVAVHYAATLPAHLPASAARAAADRARELRYADKLGAHVRAAAGVALARAAAEAGAKMDAGMREVQARQAKLVADVAQVEEAAEEMGAVRDRAALLRAQVAAVVIEDMFKEEESDENEEDGAQSDRAAPMLGPVVRV